MPLLIVKVCVSSSKSVAVRLPIKVFAASPPPAVVFEEARSVGASFTLFTVIVNV